MGPKPAETADDHDLFRTELVNLIDWQAFANDWRQQFVCTTSRPALPRRLMASMLHLKHFHSLGDEDTVERWTAKRRTALILDTIQGKTTVAEASRAQDLPPSELEECVDEGNRGMENALRS